MNDQLENQFVFVLGREQEIALAELKAVLFRFDFCFSIIRITGNQVFANIDKFTINDAKRVIDALAGTIKIYKLEGQFEKDLASQIASIFREYKTGTEGKINFGISYFGKGFSKQIINSIALTAKKQLKGDFSIRYVEARDSQELSSIVSLKNNLATKGIEFGLFDNTIGVLFALNNPEEWSVRDYEKPAADKFSGMLPPKLARMMLNLALGQIANKEENIQHKMLMFDPFCGSGNAVLEAMMLNLDAVGSDISEKAAKDTEDNIGWLINKYHLSNIKYSITQVDATSDSLAKNLKPEIVGHDAMVVVCEPFLGEPKKFKPSLNATYGEYSKVRELYMGFLANFRKTIAAEKSFDYNNVALCMVFPLVETIDGKRFSLLEKSVDEIRELGYTQACKSFIYGRDYQVVKREIVLFKLT